MTKNEPLVSLARNKSDRNQFECASRASRDVCAFVRSLLTFLFLEIRLTHEDEDKTTLVTILFHLTPPSMN